MIKVSQITSSLYRLAWTTYREQGMGSGFDAYKDRQSIDRKHGHIKNFYALCKLN